VLPILRKALKLVSVYPGSSIIIPAHNESARIEETLREVVACVCAKGWNAEEIVVNDGSPARQAPDFAVNSGPVRMIDRFKAQV
jgi:cellulose synthase/poly-beta-1,6-N-acetylglucosamine synthase-like glycosyltransferase